MESASIFPNRSVVFDAPGNGFLENPKSAFAHIARRLGSIRRAQLTLRNQKLARGRMISKSLSTSKKFAQLGKRLGKLGEFGQVLYPLVLSHVDDFGRMEADPFTVKHLCFPSSPRPEKDFTEAIRVMSVVGLIRVSNDQTDTFYLQIVDFDAHQQGLHKRTTSRFPEIPGNSGEFPPKRTEENRREENRTEGKDDSPAEVSAAPEIQGEEKITPEELMESWNDVASSIGLSSIREIAGSRRDKTNVRLREHPKVEFWQSVFGKLKQSKFLKGETSNGKGPHATWKASFDWLMENDVNATKVAEGRYA